MKLKPVYECAQKGTFFMQHYIHKYKENESVQFQFVFSETLLDITFHLAFILTDALLVFPTGIFCFPDNFFTDIDYIKLCLCIEKCIEHLLCAMPLGNGIS